MDNCKKLITTRCCLGPTGPTGPTGPVSLAENIQVRNTITSNPGEDAKVIDTKQSLTHLLDFVIPRGETGPTGANGTSVTILGSYSTYDELILEHPTGNEGDGYLVGDDLYVWSENELLWKNVGKIRGPQGIQGPTGPTGPTGPAGNPIMRSAYLVTFNGNATDIGVPVASEDRLPIDREELDISDIITLDSLDETIQFNVAGYYKISIVISGYADGETYSFDPSLDFISIGFRLVGTDDIFIGASEWTYTKDPIQLKAEGIISVPNIANVYEIVNLSPSKLYLNTPKLDYIKSESYFTNSLVTIIIDYLGRQGA